MCFMIKSFPNMLMGLERIHIFKSKRLIGLHCVAASNSHRKHGNGWAWLRSNKTWALKFVFHTIFTYHKINFFPSIKKYKNHSLLMGH